MVDLAVSRSPGLDDERRYACDVLSLAMRPYVNIGAPKEAQG
jgi:hypothetical protein